MVRKMLSVLGIAIVSLLAMGGVSNASPAVAAYPPPPTVTVNVNINVIFIVNGGTVIFFGSGFDPLEGLNITVNYGPASGLRSSPALAEAAAGKRFTTQADSSGNFSTPVQLTQVGTVTLTATGLQSGRSGSLTVEVFQNESDYTGIVAGGNSSAGTWTGTGSSSSSGALASTGSSVAGPIAIGAAALFAGLAMLFFGTRGVIRRKGSRSGGTA